MVPRSSMITQVLASIGRFRKGLLSQPGGSKNGMALNIKVRVPVLVFEHYMSSNMIYFL